MYFPFGNLKIWKIENAEQQRWSSPYKQINNWVKQIKDKRYEQKKDLWFRMC